MVVAQNIFQQLSKAAIQRTRTLSHSNLRPVSTQPSLPGVHIVPSFLNSVEASWMRELFQKSFPAATTTTQQDESSFDEAVWSAVEVLHDRLSVCSTIVSPSSSRATLAMFNNKNTALSSTTGLVLLPVTAAPSQVLRITAVPMGTAHDACEPAQSEIFISAASLCLMEELFFRHYTVTASALFVVGDGNSRDNNNKNDSDAMHVLELRALYECDYATMYAEAE